MAIIMARDKLVWTSPDDREHYTLHLGSQSGVLDLHRTRVAADGSKTHTTLFTISHENLAAMLESVGGAALVRLRGVLRRLRPGWMARKRIGAMLGVFPGDADVPAVTTVRHRKLVIDEGRLASRARIPETLEELYGLQDGEWFVLFSCHNPGKPRRIGMGVKVTDTTGRPRLMWFRERDLGPVLRHFTQEFHEAASRYGTFHQALPWW